ncbi:hypothetical protein [Sanguibacter sp. HDW7]|uniref:hypothetical protein n=1 Tax=Sanguibacter sp. HDW7 TaxID=2714931 RepID=UPI00140BD2FA|nr:hypothetical protein [Sanguibacter sp. HDW7]QIK82398.1 hypothetical protein G7063_01300 [Sanguibacter sp. HDW7]
MAFVEVYRKDTGEKVRVPESHLRIFPESFTRTPRRPAEVKAAPAASTTKPADKPAVNPKEDA